ncbi:DEAD/DEAH box helicase family protein [Ochrobactrum intermedium]|uniref:DEAD/DEAH box helicase n=1 Tax=Brucella intermedia TaxID=94625 RepID=UPI00159C32DD|nr:DEAD/DEAH box helicase [Brucella intermedia]NVM42511.1 DEAD/DEAH box helicase family protein [Brucella intermedia]
MDTVVSANDLRTLSRFVHDECERRLRAYEAQPRDAAEHYETENEVLSGGYAYRQLYELVQNAADAILEAGESQGRICVRLATDRLEAANTGAALDEQGIVALLNARSSPKRGNQIGRFGIGFKSLLKLGGRVDLTSRSVGLRFDPDACRDRIRRHLGLAADARAPGMRLAEVLDPGAEDSPLSDTGRWKWATTVVSAEIADRAAFDRLKREIADFPAEFLLFLTSAISLELEVEGAAPRLLTKRFEDGLAVVSDGTNEARWKVFEASVKVDSLAARSDATHIQAREQVPLSWAVPVGGREQAGRFWAFFPTETQSRTSGILNAPWKLNSDRTNLIRGPWNEAIMQAAADLISGSLTALSTPEDYGAAVSAFPRQPERQDEIAVPLIRSLWDQIVSSEVLPDVNGIPRGPSQLLRHFVEDTEICRSWAGLASADARDRYLHPDCYSTEARLSRLNALVTEAKRRDMQVLAKSPADKWLDCIANTDLALARQALAFVGSLLREPYEYRLYSVPEARLIPTADGRLATPSEAVIVSGSEPPAGFLAVAEGIASDEESREILVNQMHVTELASASWSDILEASLTTAEESDGPEDWENFWHNIASAPQEARQEYIDELDLERIKFRAVSGKWTSRSLFIVRETPSGYPEDHVMDPQFRRQIETTVPPDWLSEFPSIEESVDRDDPDFKDYLRLLSPGFDEICREHSGSTPRYLPKFSSYSIRMPGGWRLLPVLPSASSAQLSRLLFGATEHLAESASKVTIVHPTRADAYPKVTAPHPIYFWLTEHGRIRVGNLVVPLKCITTELAKILADAEVQGFKAVEGFLRARDAETDLGSRFAWRRSKLTRDATARFWEQVFTSLSERKSDFKDLRPVWEVAHADGAIPATLPSADGALPLSEIYVTADPSVGHDLDDGRIILLSEDVSSAWVAAGAMELGAGPSMSFEKHLSAPSYLLDLFPELAAAQEDSEVLGTIPAVWVSGLEESVGPFRRVVTVGMDADGAFLIDREQFGSRGWKEGVELLLRCLARHGIIDDGADLEEILSRIMDRRSDEARKAIRDERSLELRLLKAIGGDIETLLGTLTPVTRQAVENHVDPESLARLALAVHGPTLLSRLRDALELRGLAPPKRWGGEQARVFVQELGFPIEFAASVGGRRDAELSVSGPIHLPPLHDYQEDILNSIGALLDTGTGRRRAVVSLPTGGGKTRVAAEAVVRLVLKGEGRRTALWIAQTDELCEQAVQCFRQLWVNVGEPGEDLRIARLWGGQRNPSPPEADEPTVVIASIQTLNSRSGRPELAWVAQAGIVIIDECHHAITSSYTDLLRWLDVQVGSERAREREAPVLGLSATPWRGYNEDESERLAARFDRRWFPADQAGLHDKLSEMGVLADRSYRPLRYDRPITLTEREQQHVDTFGELPDSVVDRMGEDSDRNDLIIDAIASSKAESILLFANSVAHAQYLAARLHLAGCPAAAVSGQTDRLARQHFTRRFRAGDLRVICNHSVLTTGFDAPKADMVLISRPVFSPVLYMQMVGRGLRGPANGGTAHCEIMTVEDNIINFKDRLAYHFCRRFFDT